MPPAPQQTLPVRIGDWILVPELNLLRHAERNTEVRLEPRHADLLCYFAAHAGEVLNADDIIEHVWNRQVVTDQSVYQAIAKLRRAVGDNASAPRYIETVPKRGYRLIATVDSTADSADSHSPAVPASADTAATAPPNRRRLGLALVLMAIAAVIIAIALQRPGDIERQY